MNNQSTGVIVGILIVLVVIVVGYIAYDKGYFEGQEEDSTGVEIKLGSDY